MYKKTIWTKFLKAFLNCVLLGITILIDILFNCVFLKKKETCNKSACQVSDRKVLMTVVLENVFLTASEILLSESLGLTL